MGHYIKTTIKYKVKQVKGMSDFNRRSNLIKDDSPTASNSGERKGKSLVESILGDAENFKLVAERFNLDPEMAEKIVVPLLSLLDKYKIGESITSSPQLESASNTMEIIRDVAPVVKGAAEFISGRRAELKADDLEFLEQIKKSQSVGDASLFGEGEDELFTIGESLNEPKKSPQKPAPNFNSFAENDWGDFWADAAGASQQKTFLDNDLTRQMEAQQSALDNWANEQTGGSMKREKAGPHTTQTEGVGGEFNLGDGFFNDTFAAQSSTTFGLVDVSQLAKEAGLSVNEVMDSDSQMKMVEKEQDFNSFTIDLNEFESEEKKPIDYTEFETPEDAETFDPLSIVGYSVPKLEVDLKEFQEMLPEVFEDEQED